MEEINMLIQDKFKEGQLATDGDKLVLWEGSDLLEDNKDFAAKINYLFGNLDVLEADDEFDQGLFHNYLSMELAIDCSSKIHSLCM